MRILHYFLGFPPYRAGGLTKYAMDLMDGQIRDGHTVMAFWPGRIKLFDRTTVIKKERAVKGIESYELIDPLPVPLDEGIQDIKEYMRPCDRDIYDRFLFKVRPDVIHIHTLMGLHKEFIDSATLLKIKTVFTTHDYFGICPKVTLYRDGQVCDEDHGHADCVCCNSGALSLNKIRILQSPLYRTMKNMYFVRYLRKKHRSHFFSEDDLSRPPLADVEREAKQYEQLRRYYVGMLEKIDLIHFNSTVAEMVYRRYLLPKASRVLSITHQAIADNKRINSWYPDGILKITYLAPARPFKGFLVLKAALDELWDAGKQDFKLRVYSPVSDPSPYMDVHAEGFCHDELGAIMAETDVLAAPSIWYETFGFTVLEAISYGVPVIVSDHVGAKDIIGRGGLVVKAGDKQQLKQAIGSLTADRLRQIRKEIIADVQIKVWRTLMDETYQMYEMSDQDG